MTEPARLATEEAEREAVIKLQALQRGRSVRSLESANAAGVPFLLGPVALQEGATRSGRARAGLKRSSSALWNWDEGRASPPKSQPASVHGGNAFARQPSFLWNWGEDRGAGPSSRGNSLRGGNSFATSPDTPRTCDTARPPSHPSVEDPPSRAEPVAQAGDPCGTGARTERRPQSRSQAASMAAVPSWA